jgi:single-stranded-DNA-specific exonuclease
MLRLAGKNQSGVNASDLGFKLGPRLNAAGRLKDISIGIQCLLTSDVGTALKLANHLNALNQERRAIEEGMQAEALHLIEGLQLGQSERLPNVICLYKPDWHEGILGLLASRIKERYHRPVLICARESTSVGPTYQVKGSCRSIPKLHIRDALSAVALKHADLEMKFGGHAMAAGFSIREDRLELLFTAFRKHVNYTLKNENFDDVCLTDGELDITQINTKTAALLDDAGPWGSQFPEPTFDGIFIVERQQILKKKYLKMTLSFPEQRNSMLDAICFNVDVNEWNNEKTSALHCVYRLKLNEYRGTERLQLLIDYFQPIYHKKAASV